MSIPLSVHLQVWPIWPHSDCDRLVGFWVYAELNVPCHRNQDVIRHARKISNTVRQTPVLYAWSFLYNGTVLARHHGYSYLFRKQEKMYHQSIKILTLCINTASLHHRLEAISSAQLPDIPAFNLFVAEV